MQTATIGIDHWEVVILVIMEEQNKGEIIIYQSEDGTTKLDVRLENETIWLTQKSMAELFGVEIPTINYHLKEVFRSEELQEEVVIRKFLTTTLHGAIEGKTQTREVNFYDLNAIIAVGYRVNSKRATQFRIWATGILKEYLIKGFALDDERLKGNAGGRYWRELLQRIQDIRMDERMIYRQVLDLFATAYDYDGKSETAHEFFAAYQNKFHFAIHKHTASELILERADANKEFMGLTVIDEGINSITVTIAKNYMTETELSAMRSLVSGFFDFAEMQAQLHTPMYMNDYMKLLEDLITVNRRPLLSNKGTRSMKQAKEYARAELKKYKARNLSSAEKDYMESIKALNAKAKNGVKKLKGK